jgi:2-octaprenyl-6-methoxyphenol hydroxylase
MKTKDLIADIVISGAGPAGLTLAALMGRAGFKIILVDAEKFAPANYEEKPSGRTAALLTGSVNVIKAAGIWNDIKDHATPLQIMRIIDDSQKGGKQVKIEFKVTDIGHSEFGFNIPNAVLKSALAARIAKIPTIMHLTPSKLKNYKIEKQKIEAVTEDGAILRAPLIIGTDGRGSVVRAVAGIDAKKHDYEQMAMTCLIEHTKPHNFTSTEFHRSGGPFTLVPMPGNTSSVVWVEKKDDAKKYLALKKQEFQQAIQDRSCGLLGTITLVSNPESWPLMLLSSETLIGERAALAAEAAHVLSPIGAQGLNLSLRDVATLAEIIVDAARLGEDIGSQSVLMRYERRRRADIKSHVIGIDGLNRAVANDMGFLKDLRRLGLKGLDTIPAFKNFITHQGLAPAMDEGRLLSGGTL